MRFDFTHPCHRARGPFVGLLLIVTASALATPTYAQVDLTISCTESSPTDPNLFVDGNTITLDCTASNAGPGATGATGAVAYISDDTVVSPNDTLIGEHNVSGITGGGMTAFTLSGAPSFTISGPFNICVKIDARDRDQRGQQHVLPSDPGVVSRARPYGSQPTSGARAHGRPQHGSCREPLPGDVHGDERRERDRPRSRQRGP